MKINKHLFFKLIKTEIDLNKFVNKLTLLGYESIIIDDYIDINIPYNRHDCTSLFGLFREYNKFNNDIFFSILENKNDIETKLYNKRSIEINIKEKTFCPLYCYAIIKVTNKSNRLPVFLLDTLKHNNINSINNIVDILNYITLITGQPFHAYNLDSVSKKITISKTKNFNFKTINNEKIISDKNTIVINSDNKILALPGVIGAFDSKIYSNTENILLEAAFFNKKYIKNISLLNKIETSSSNIFSFGIDYNFTEKSFFYLLSFIKNNLDCDIIEYNKIFYDSFLPDIKKIKLEKKKINYIFNRAINIAYIRSFFKKNFFFYENNNFFVLSIPYYRNDISFEEHLISELEKLYGYQNIFRTSFNYFVLDKKILNRYDFKKILTFNGFNEIISYSFVNNNIEEIFNTNKKFVYISNTISKSFNIMRPSLKQGLINCIKHNYNRQHKNIKIFECGNVYNIQNNEKIIITEMLSYCILVDNKDINDNFFFLKEISEKIIYSNYNINNITFYKSKSNFFEDDLSINFYNENNVIGELGLINKNILNKISFKKNILFASILLNDTNACLINTFTELSKQPSIIRDISFIINKNISFFSVYTFISNLKIKNLIKIFFLDSFVIDNYDRSLTIRLKFNNKEKTLFEKDVDLSIKYIIKQAIIFFKIKIKQ